MDFWRRGVRDVVLLVTRRGCAYVLRGGVLRGTNVYFDVLFLIFLGPISLRRGVVLIRHFVDRGVCILVYYVHWCILCIVIGIW